MMSLNRISLVMALALSAAVSTSALAREDLPAVNDEGMELVKDSDLTTVYADPDADLSIYKRILLKDATVAFKKNWKRNQNRNTMVKINTREMENIQADVATLLNDVFTKELIDGGYELVDEAGDDVLIVLPAIVDLDVTAPDIPRAGRTNSFSESAGEMTLHLELFDSVTNDKIAKATDRKRDYRRGYAEWRTSVSNRAVAKRFMRSWAEALKATLDDAKSSTSNSD
jgi:hypothetical protein